MITVTVSVFVVRTVSAITPLPLRGRTGVGELVPRVASRPRLGGLRSTRGYGPTPHSGLKTRRTRRGKPML